MSDHIIRGMAANNQVRFFAGTTREYRGNRKVYPQHKSGGYGSSGKTSDRRSTYGGTV